MSDSNNVKVSNSNIGAMAVGGGSATGSVTTSTVPQTQLEHRAAVTKAQSALLGDQDAIDELGTGIYEALGQFLRIAREIQVENKTLAQLQTQMQATLDDVWADKVAADLRPTALPATLEFVKTIGGLPVMVKVAEKLIGA